MNSEHRIIITGTGRAGTTFLMRLLTELGLDTGYSPEEAAENINHHCHAGLEFSLAERLRDRTARDWLRQPRHTVRDLVRGPPPAPYIVKSPAFCDDLEGIIASRTMVVDHVYIPMRDLDAAALSRVRVGGRDGSQPGGLWKTDDPAQQKAVLAEMFFHLVHTLAVHDVPHTFLLFPRLVEDWTYTYHKLWLLVKDIDAERFRTVFSRLADRKLVHSFAHGNPVRESHPTVPAPSSPPEADSRRERRPARRAAPAEKWREARARLACWLYHGRIQQVMRLAAWGAALVTMGGNFGEQAASAAKPPGPQPLVAPVVALPATPPPLAREIDFPMPGAAGSDAVTLSGALAEAIREAQN